MGASTPTIDRNMGAIDVVSTSLSVVTSDLRIAAFQFVAGLVAIVPLIGPLVAAALSGLSAQFADETLGNTDPRNSTVVRFVFAIASGFVAGVLTLIGFVFLIIPGIYLSLKFALVLPAIWVDDRGPLQALSASWERTSGNLLTLLGVQLLMLFVALALVVPAFTVFLSGVALESLADGGFLLASPVLIATIVAVVVAIGSIAVAAQTVMYRAFADRHSGDAPGALNDTTQF